MQGRAPRKVMEPPPLGRSTTNAPMCCVMPPASPAATEVFRSESRSVVLPAHGGVWWGWWVWILFVSCFLPCGDAAAAAAALPSQSERGGGRPGGRIVRDGAPWSTCPITATTGLRGSRSAAAPPPAAASPAAAPFAFTWRGGGSRLSSKPSSQAASSAVSRGTALRTDRGPRTGQGRRVRLTRGSVACRQGDHAAPPARAAAGTGGAGRRASALFEAVVGAPEGGEDRLELVGRRLSTDRGRH